LVFLAPLRGLTRNFLLANGRFVALRNTQILELALFAAALWIGSAARGIEGLCIGVSAWSVASLALYLVRVSQVVRFELRRVLLLPSILLPAIIALNQFVRGQAAVAQLGTLALACLSSALVLSACAGALIAVESRDLRALIRRLRS
jgi:hypothetical protein